MTIGEYVLPQLIGQFKARFPAVVPTLFVGNSEAVQERVAERTLDLGFIESGSPLATLQSEVCCEDELQVVCAPTHPLAKEPFASPASLTQHPYISREAGSGTRGGRSLPSAGRRVPESMNRVVELGSPEAIKGLVATGMGFAIMSRVIAAKELQLGHLVQVALRRRFFATSPWSTRRSASTPSSSPASSPSRKRALGSRRRLKHCGHEQNCNLDSGEQRSPSRVALESSGRSRRC